MVFSTDPELVPQVKYIHSLIEKRIGAKEFKNNLEPCWFRGLSNVQMSAVHGLSDKLSDDILEGSTYRVYNQLNRLGIEPRPPQKELRKVFTLSRGNDVAFLWFLMELFYKSSDCPTDIYNFNEQIIMSGIFWLDIFPTLRELDRLLPLPHKSAEVRAKLMKKETERIRREERRQQLEYAKQMKQSKSSLSSPYFDNPNPYRPRQRRLVADYPPVQFRSLNIPDDPQSDAALQTRWFGDFIFDEGKRVTNSLLDREINNVLMSLKAAKVSQTHVASMCVHHQRIKEMEQSLKTKMELFKQKQMERLLQVGQTNKERRQQRLLRELDHLTEQYLAKFHEMAVKTRIESARKRLSADFNEPDFYFLCEEVFPADNTSDLELNEMQATAFLIENPPPPACRDTMPRQTGGQDGAKYAKQRQSSLMQFLLLGGVETEKKNTEKDYDTPSSSSSSPSPCPCPSNSSKCFEFSKFSYKFNYQNLFGTDRKKMMLDDEHLRLKVAFIKALDNDVEYIHKLLDGDQGVLESCVDRTVCQMVKKGIDNFEKRNKNADVGLTPVKTDARLDFGLEYYDADNLHQMKNMLRVGLEHVAKDHRYVLPTLPNVHLVPLLIEWIRARYGKQYSEAETERISTQAMKLMDNLSLIFENKILRRTVKVKLTGKESVSKIIKKQREARNRILHLFGSSVLEVGRVFQSIMENSNDTNARSTYFAYMPAHTRDVDINQTPTYIDRRRRKS